jgi:LysR family transcriptional regulator, low CO2-responsive transcriptional regulator
MNYEWAFAFTVFAEHLNFTRAARQLHISQPALHVQIKKLTEQVGRPLYRRSGRTLSLTPEGKRLAAFGREISERGRTLLGELRGESISGPVILASGNGAFLYLLGSAIRRFPKNKWPLRLVSMSGPESLEAVRDAKAQLCVVAMDTVAADLASVPLRAVGQMVIVHGSHRFARRRSLSADDLASEPVVAAPTGSPHRVMLQQLVRARGLELNVAVEATGWELMLQFARYGVGLAVVNDFCVVPKGMVGVPLEGAPEITYYLVSRPGPTAKSVEVLRELILETVRA